MRIGLRVCSKWIDPLAAAQTKQTLFRTFVQRCSCPCKLCSDITNGWKETTFLLYLTGIGTLLSSQRLLIYPMLYLVNAKKT